MPDSSPMRLNSPAPTPCPAHSLRARPTTDYVVRAGDTIGAIARRHGRSTQSVLTANGLRWSSIIRPGQHLAIPVGSAPAVARAAAPVPITDAPGAPRAAGGTHTVRVGDTLSQIARSHGVSVAALLKANGFDWSSIVYPGQRVVIPRSGLPGLSADQAANARRIVRIGRMLAVPGRGLAIAAGVAMQESGLRNVDRPGHEGVGLFRRMPDTGWGTAVQLRDVDRSIRVFFTGSAVGASPRLWGLLEVPDWERLPFAEAGAAVVPTPRPQLYAQWELPALAWLDAIG